MNFSMIARSFLGHMAFIYQGNPPCSWKSETTCWVLPIFLGPDKSSASKAFSVLRIHRRQSCDLRKSPLYEKVFDLTQPRRRTVLQKRAGRIPAGWANSPLSFLALVNHQCNAGGPQAESGYPFSLLRSCYYTDRTRL